MHPLEFDKHPEDPEQTYDLPTGPETMTDYVLRAGRRWALTTRSIA